MQIRWILTIAVCARNILPIGSRIGLTERIQAITNLGYILGWVRQYRYSAEQNNFYHVRVVTVDCQHDDVFTITPHMCNTIW